MHAVPHVQAASVTVPPAPGEMAERAHGQMVMSFILCICRSCVETATRDQGD
jgi:hypothetical protein